MSHFLDTDICMDKIVHNLEAYDCGRHVYNDAYNFTSLYRYFGINNARVMWI